MSDLRGDLASLRIDRSPGPRRGHFLRWALVAVALGTAALGLAYHLKNVPLEVTDAPATLEKPAAGAGEGMPLLTASGYVVARRKAVVSAKIQGRLAEL